MFDLPMTCYGCGACAVICPGNAIEMKLHKNGIFFPIMNEKRCIGCNMCNDVCISKSNFDNTIGKYGIFAAWSNSDEIRRCATSGGIASEILRYASKHETYTCGVIYDRSKKIAKHVVLYPKSDVGIFTGSKYLQSFNAEAFREIIDINSKAVVVSTPCQIAGLDLVIRKKGQREKYLLVELICKSIPTYNLFLKYIDCIIRKEEMDNNINIKFRDPEILAGGGINVHIWDDFGHDYCANEEKDPFYKLFLSGYGCMESCYDCKFCLKSNADIRIGDFWGPRYRKANGIGYSMILANSKRGLNYLEKINIHLQKVGMSEYMSQKIVNAKKPEDYDDINAAIMDPLIGIDECATKVKENRDTLMHRLSKYLPVWCVIFLKKIQWIKFCKSKGRVNK